MSDSRALDIYQACIAALTTPAMTAIPTVYDNRLVPVERDELPAVAVEMGDEPEPDTEGRTIGTVARELTVDAHILIDSATPYSAADAAVQEVYGLLLADRTLGGLATEVREPSISRQRDDAGVGRVTLSFRVEFRTAAGSLT